MVAVCFAPGIASKLSTKRRLVAISLFSLAPFFQQPRRTMAWTCHGSSNDDLVDKLVHSKIIKSSEVENAMRKVDRGLFTLSPGGAYKDSPQGIGHGATISAPHMHAHCMELLRTHLQPGNVILDVGSGTGYLTAVMAYMVSAGGQDGQAVGVEHISELVYNSVESCKRIPWARDMLKDGSLKLLQGDGREGYAPSAPYDCIHVGAASPRIPEALTNQLKPGGRLLLPVGPEVGPQSLVVVDKEADGHFKVSEAFGVMYVPLTDQAHQLGRQFF